MAKNPASLWLLRIARQSVRTTFLSAFLSVLPCHGQQQPPASSSSPAVTRLEEQSDLRGNTHEPELVESQTAPKNDRLFYVLPNYTTVEGKDRFQPLSAKTKFKLSAKTMSDPVTISFLGVIALIGQARNGDPSYGQGFQGYAKRYGTILADTGIGTVMTTSLFPTLLRQDPRYFQLGKGGTRRRALYSVSRIFVTRTDSGELQPNYSEIIGNGVAAAISNTYHPQNQRTLGNTLSVWGTETMLNSICNVAKEFWPDIRRKISKQRHPTSTTSGSLYQPDQTQQPAM